MKNRIIKLTVLAMTVYGCGSASPNFLQYGNGDQYTTDVEIFNGITDSIKTFKPPVFNNMSIEDKYKFGLIINTLIDDGWRADEQSGNLLNVQYTIDDGKEETYSSPVLGQVPTGNSQKSTQVTVNPYGNSANITSTATQQTRLAVTGYTTNTRTVFTRIIKISVVKEDTSEEVWLCNMKSSGSTDNLSVVMPHMLATLSLIGDGNHEQKEITLGDKSIHVLEFKSRIGAN